MTHKSSVTNHQFNQLITALGTDLELTGEEIADIIWFFQKRQEIITKQNDAISQPVNKSNVSEGLITTPTDTSEKLNTIPTNTPEQLNPTPANTSEQLKPPPTNTQPSTQPPPAKISPKTEEKLQTSSKNQALPLRVPDAPSLREPLTLAQALKPLMCRVESGRKTVLDETVTVKRIAASGISIPILKSEPEPWLDVALVVDESKSMLIWRHTIWELKRLLEHYGVFRDVRAWGLVTDENEQIHIRPGIGKNARQQRLASHREILDPNRRRLILLVSDCVAAMWRNGAITQVLKDWTNTQPVAIIQMLPDWLWLKTGLGLGAAVSLGSLTSGVANKHLLVKKLLLWKDINLDTGIKIPVFTLEPHTALPWSQMLAGKSDAVASGFVLSSAVKVNSSKQPQTTTPQINPQERVHRFRMTASPMGRKLAGLLAAAPVINLPVVRLVQETLLPESRQVHVAEVFLGGLLKPLTTIAADTLPDTVQYDFMDDEIRGMLLEAAPVKDSTDVFDAVSRYVAAELGKSLQDFVALLTTPEAADKKRVKPFAEVAVKILKRLGGEYAAFAERLEQNFPTHRQSFEFEVATIEREEGKWVINRRRQQNQYFTEDLGNGIELEIVHIPGGTFTMGAPKTEEGSRDSERPQHQVKVPSFFMGRYPVTQEQWRAIASREDLKVEHDLEPNPSKFKGYQESDRCPIERVSWYDAVEFCARLSKQIGKEYRLPSEAEWEYACRAETITPFHFGETITSTLANYDANYTYGGGSKGKYRSQTTPVGSFEVANAFGLFDMHGNVWEWCLDDWHDNYENAPTNGSAWFESEYNSLFEKIDTAVLRGGSWFYFPEVCRSACRSYIVRAERDFIPYSFGFRVVCAFGGNFK